MNDLVGVDRGMIASDSKRRNVAIAILIGMALEWRGFYPYGAAVVLVSSKRIFTTMSPLGRYARRPRDIQSCQHAIPLGKYAAYHAAGDLLSLPLAPFSPAPYAPASTSAQPARCSPAAGKRTVVAPGARRSNARRQRSESGPVHCPTLRDSCGSPTIGSEFGPPPPRSDSVAGTGEPPSLTATRSARDELAHSSRSSGRIWEE